MTRANTLPTMLSRESPLHQNIIKIIIKKRVLTGLENGSRPIHCKTAHEWSGAEIRLVTAMSEHAKQIIIANIVHIYTLLLKHRNRDIQLIKIHPVALSHWSALTRVCRLGRWFLSDYLN